MGKPTGKKIKNPEAPSSSNRNKKHGDAHAHAQSKHSKGHDRGRQADEEDTAVFITMSHELKEQGNKLFQRRDPEGAMLLYEKALKLLPRSHIGVASLRTSMASCFMQMGIGEYPRAINECNLALEVAPKYSKALLRRARCFEALNRLDLAWRDVRAVLSIEPNNLGALEMGEGIKKAMEDKGVDLDEKVVGVSASRFPGPPNGVVPSNSKRSTKEKPDKKKKKAVKVEAASSQVEPRLKTQHREAEENTEGEVNQKHEEAEEETLEDRSNPEDKEVVQEGDRVVTRAVKLVFGDDIRWALLPTNCDVLLMKDIVRDRFPNLKGALVKYRDREGDLITITTTDELRHAEGSDDSQGTLRMYIAEVNPDEEPVYGSTDDKEANRIESHSYVDESMDNGVLCIDNWIIQFAQIFKNHVGFDSDGCLKLHELGMALYSEAIEDTVSSEEAQELFDVASDKFQEMAALALFNWGNVHMSKAGKQVILQEDDAGELVASQIKAAYEGAQNEYRRAGMRYEEALKIKPDFYEGRLALGSQQFEQAKLCWNYALATEVDLEAGASSEVLQLYNKAEDNMEAGMQLWEEMEEGRLNGLSKEEKHRSLLQKMGMDGGLVKDMPADEASEQAAIMTSQINILWGTLLYERSVVEFKLGLPSWEECLEVAVEKFELAGASHVDMGVMVKNHISNQAGKQDFGFKIDEIVQAWHEMYDAKRWQMGARSFRLEPLFKRRLPRIHSMMEHV